MLGRTPPRAMVTRDRSWFSSSLWLRMAGGGSELAQTRAYILPAQGAGPGARLDQSAARIRWRVCILSRLGKRRSGGFPMMLELCFSGVRCMFKVHKRTCVIRMVF